VLCVRACERATEGNMAVCTVVVTTDELLVHSGVQVAPARADRLKICTNLEDGVSVAARIGVIL